MTDFDYDSYQKKNIAHSASRRKCGAKSKRCTLPSDRLSAAEKRKLNGKVVSYHMRKPMKWNEFLEMPEDLQMEYIRSLVQSFDCTSKCIADMFGVRRETFSKFLAGSPIDIKFQRGHKMSERDRKAWDVFIGVKQAEPEAEPEQMPEAEQPADPVQKTEPEPEAVSEPQKPACAMTEFSVQFTGEIRLQAIFDAMQYLINAGYTKGNVRISCTDLA